METGPRSSIFLCILDKLGTIRSLIHFSPFQSDRPLLAETESRRSEMLDHRTTVEDTTMDGNVARNADGHTEAHQEEESDPDATDHVRGTPDPASHQADGMSTVREEFRKRGISHQGTELLMASWKPGTEKQYRPHVRRWLHFCDRSNFE